MHFCGEKSGTTQNSSPNLTCNETPVLLPGTVGDYGHPQGSEAGVRCTETCTEGWFWLQTFSLTGLSLSLWEMGGSMVLPVC